jgi:hypothetical protein
MAAGGVEIVEKWKRKREDSRRGTWSCQWVGGGDGWWSVPGVVRENEVAAARQANNHDMMLIHLSHPASSAAALSTPNAANTSKRACSDRSKWESSGKLNGVFLFLREILITTVEGATSGYAGATVQGGARCECLETIRTSLSELYRDSLDDNLDDSKQGINVFKGCLGGHLYSRVLMLETLANYLMCMFRSTTLGSHRSSMNQCRLGWLQTW